ncbi:hypothetical protein O4158_21050 [Gordonia amicalis]|uniref:hypothetical protein n=1 Tax=Gordonia amicalis TaxID=89053 RepID=UPI0022B2E530|nr:hypothetical protein [Gordonia amicalis]MCZ4581528.1 hypothetical protein [Gordonia amicalis]
MTDQPSLLQLHAWLDAAPAVVVTAGGLIGFAAVSFTEPWQSAVTMLLIGVGTALTVLILIAVGWDKRHLLRPATVWLATQAVWVNAVVSVSGGALRRHPRDPRRSGARAASGAAPGAPHA